MPSYYYTKFQKNPCVGRNERCPLVCALILWRSGLGLLMGEFCQFLTELTACCMPIFSFQDNNLFVHIITTCSGSSLLQYVTI